MASPAKHSDDGPPVEVGDILAGKYRVDRVLGVGGMGVVVAATHVDLDELRALKFMLPRVSSDAGAVTRFFREARAAARLKSEYVARIYDIGKLESDLPFMVMEYLEGDDLRTVLKERGALSVEESVDYTMQALAGLAEAHAVGIVHRDLKPANLFLTTSTDGLPRIKIVDFGVSKLIGPAEAKAITEVTQATTLLGSPHYMSPEQLASARGVDARTDIWSLGVMLFEMLVGRVPFEGPSLTAVTIAVVQNDPGMPSELRPGVPAGLDEVVRKALSKKADGRYRNAAALAAALAPFGSPWAQELAAHVRRVHDAARVAGRASIPGNRDFDTDDPSGGSDPLAEVAAEIRGALSESLDPKRESHATETKPDRARGSKVPGDEVAGSETADSDDAGAPPPTAEEADEGTDGTQPMAPTDASAPAGPAEVTSDPPDHGDSPTATPAAPSSSYSPETADTLAAPGAPFGHSALIALVSGVTRCRTLAVAAAGKVWAAARRAEPAARRLGPKRVAAGAAVIVLLLAIVVGIRLASSDRAGGAFAPDASTATSSSEPPNEASPTSTPDGGAEATAPGPDGSPGSPPTGDARQDAGLADASTDGGPDAEAPPTRPRRRGRLPDIYDDSYVPPKKSRPPPNYRGPTTL